MFKILFDKRPCALYHGALMAAKGAEPALLIQVPRLISAGATRSGQLPVSGLPRLVDGLLDDSGVVDYTLAFGRDEDGRQLIRGQLTTRVNMQCQRCLEPVAVALTRDFVLECVWSELQFPGVAPDCEPYLMTEEPVRLDEMVEDEVLLSLPLVPRHETRENCMPMPAGTGRGETDKPQSSDHRPPEGPLAEGLRGIKRKH